MADKELMQEALKWQEHIKVLANEYAENELYQKRNKVLDWLLDQAEKAEKYREALEFYANKETYESVLINEAQYDADGVCISNDEYLPPIIYLDDGEIARKALEGIF